jgi:hypothetical protein
MYKGNIQLQKRPGRKTVPLSRDPRRCKRDLYKGKRDLYKGKRDLGGKQVLFITVLVNHAVVDTNPP